MTRPPTRRFVIRSAVATLATAAMLAWPTTGQAALTPERLRSIIYRSDPCLASIIDRENRAWDPTRDYGGGHGNVYESYGLPQANPGTKMASAGPDWRTNPWTQLKWARGYARSRYGSTCAAWEAWKRQGGWW